jgi:hypothetical protein
MELIRISAFLFTLFLVSTNLVMDVQGDTRVEDPQFDPYRGPDVPVWSIGDHWNYTTEVEYDLGLVSIDLTGWMNMSVVLITLDMFSNGDPVYITNITGNISGEQNVPFIGDVNVYIDLTGYIWSRCQDLSMYRSVLNASVSGTVSSINGDYPIGYEYSPPLEEYDFPLISGETWEVNTTATLPFGAGDLIDIVNDHSCGSTRSISVDSGSFDVYPVSIDGSETLFFNSTVGNSVLRSYSVPVGSSEITVPFELSSYSRMDQTIDIELEILEDQHIEAGSEFNLHGEVSQSNVLVNVLFPGGNLVSTKLLSLGDKEFDVQLTAPIYPDDTITKMDHGSFGILVSVNGVSSIDVITVTTKARDIEVLSDDLRIEPQGNGTIDDEFHGYLTVRNPSNFGVNNYSVLVEIEGVNGYPKVFDNLSTPAHEETELMFMIEPTDPGNYTVVVTIDFEDNVLEFNENNNIIRKNFSVKLRPDIIWESIPATGSLNITEGESKTLFARATRGGVEISGTWYLDDAILGSDNNYTFFSGFTGPNSSSSSPFIFIFELDEDQVHPGEVTNSTFELKVLDRNRKPEIVSFSPNISEIEVVEGETINLSIEAYDPDMDPLHYDWYIFDEMVDNRSNWLVIETKYVGYLSNDTSPLNIEIGIRDSKGAYCVILWNITVIDVDRPFNVSFDPEPGNHSLMVDEILNISFSAFDPDGTDISSTWTYNNVTISNSTFLNFDPDAFGFVIGDIVDVGLVLSSGTHQMIYNWSMEIEGVIDPPVPDPVPIAGLRLEEELETFYYVGETIQLNATSDDNRSLVFSWNVNGDIFITDDLTLEDLVLGVYNIRLTATSMDNIPGSSNITFTIEVREKKIIEPEPEDKDDDSGFPLWIVPLMIAIMILVVVFVLILLFIRRKDEDIGNWEE